MERNELLKELATLIKSGNVVKKANGNAIILSKDLNRLRSLKASIRKDALDSIEYRDVLDINMHNCRSFSELRNLNLDNYTLIKGFRKLSVCVFSSDNDYKGNYIYLN